MIRAARPVMTRAFLFACLRYWSSDAERAGQVDASPAQARTAPRTRSPRSRAAARLCPYSILVLSQRYELAQATVKKALAILKDERLIETTPGYGTFVRDRGQDS
jgi:hypothetical protein